MSHRTLGLSSILVALGVTVGAGQEATGVITGVILDPLGGALPGATIRVVNLVTGAAVEAVSDLDGSYRAVAPAPGRYRIEAALSGFDAGVGQTSLAVGQTAAINVTMNPSRLAEAVVVTARRIEEVVQEVPIPVSVVSARWSTTPALST